MTGFGGVEDGLDDRHVLDGVFDGNGDFRVFQDSLGEGVGLQGVLIADGKGLRRDTAAEEVAPVVDEEARGAVGRRVEGDFHLDAPTGAEKLDALVGDQLRAASEDGLAVGKVENRRGEPVGMHRGIPVDAGDYSRGLLCKGKAGCVDEVAADVHESATAALYPVADVGRVDIEVTVNADDGAKLSDAALAE